MQALINSLLQRVERLERQLRNTQNFDSILSRLNEKPDLGVPEGGSAGQVLVKTGAGNRQYSWITLSGAGTIDIYDGGFPGDVVTQVIDGGNHNSSPTLVLDGGTI
jgi:hypothetical protein